MELLQRREQEIFETLKKIQRHTFVIENCAGSKTPHFSAQFSIPKTRLLTRARKTTGFSPWIGLEWRVFVIIGGYAVNAYTLPRFSVDCDLVIEDRKEQENIETDLVQLGYGKEELINPKTPYHGSFVRYVKNLPSNFKVSMDLLFGEVVDRQTKAGFTAKWVFNQSESRALKGKTITENIKLLIINPEALVAMKVISCRINDIRDIFMLAPLVKNKKWVQEELAGQISIKVHFRKIVETVQSPEFKNNLQGVYGFIDQKIFEKHQRAVLALE